MLAALPAEAAPPRLLRAVCLQLLAFSAIALIGDLRLKHRPALDPRNPPNPHEQRIRVVQIPKPPPPKPPEPAAKPAPPTARQSANPNPNANEIPRPAAQATLTP